MKSEYEKKLDYENRKGFKMLLEDYVKIFNMLEEDIVKNNLREDQYEELTERLNEYNQTFAFQYLSMKGYELEYDEFTQIRSLKKVNKAKPVRTL